jgi:undecaprenyl-diphosphatase
LNFLDVVISLLYGVVQGITEWLPVSSTAHLMLLDWWAPAAVSEEVFQLFLVAVQLSSALAVLVLYFRRLCPIARRCRREDRADCLSLWGRMLVGCVPAALVGFFLDDAVESFFTSGGRGGVVIGTTLALYGIIFIAGERFFFKKQGKNSSLSSMPLRDALAVGVFQILALIPGTSRSGATVLGAMLMGYDRGQAAEFSFFLALPAMLGATLLRGVKLMASGIVPSGDEVAFLMLGCVASFLVSLAALRFLVDFVSRRGFAVFGWYRLALSALIFGALLL